MARGRGRGHKGQRRHFTNPDDLNAEKDKKDKEKSWRQKRGDSDTDSDEESDDNSDGSNSQTDSEGEEGKAKGVSSLIEVENPNRVHKKTPKVNNLDAASSSKDETQLSRREREEIEKQRARENYARLHAQGKTDQARADLARLAIIKQQREEAQRKRDEEKKIREQESKAKVAQTNRALGKK